VIEIRIQIMPAGQVEFSNRPVFKLDFPTVPYI
jgi:hypothetical protein